MQLKAWHMLDQDQIVSQFDRNYNGEIDANVVQNEIGVSYYHINVNDLNNDDKFNKLKKEMGVTYQDSIIISPEKVLIDFIPSILTYKKAFSFNE